MKNNSMNKAVAGFRMLKILSSVDGNINHSENKVIETYISENFKEHIDLDFESGALKIMPKEDYPINFNNAMNAFYLDSTQDERTHFLDLAVRLVIADKKITPRENLFLNELFNAWEANYSF